MYWRRTVPIWRRSRNRGKKNSSLYLPNVVEAVSRLKGVDPETVMKADLENGKKLDYRL